MSELRQDPITRDWIIVNPARAQRPHDTGGGAAQTCPFCPGREHLTLDEVDRIDGADGHWLVRSVLNRYPVLAENAAAPAAAGEATAAAGPDWRRQAGDGRHEVIVETPEHAATFGTLPAEHLRRVLAMYLRRFRALAAHAAWVRQVALFRNEGARAGSSLTHPHAQIVAVPVVAPATRRRMDDEIARYDATGACALCEVLAAELAAGARVVHQSAHFVTLAPYASRVPFQIQIVPRAHCPAFGEVDESLLDDLAPHLGTVFRALERRLGDLHYNLVVMTPPLDQVHRQANHWFIDIRPRQGTPAGFELGTWIAINTQTPEHAAAELRAAIGARSF
jgi:UDPglucose--hexose-1-phosphate uridylyltransferase